MKKLSILALVLVLILSLTGCYNDEIKLYDAFKKSQDITSLESDTVINLALDIEGFTEEEAANYQMIKEAVNSFSLKINQKMKQDESKAKVQAMVDFEAGFDIMGMSMGAPMSIWVDGDLSDDNFKLVEIIKLPEILMGFVPVNMKEYIVYDFNEIFESGENLNISEELLDFAINSEARFKSIADNAVKNLNIGFPVVKYKGMKLFYGEKLNIYEIRLNDAQYKSLVRNAVNYFMEDKDVLEFIKEYVDLAADMAVNMAGGSQAEKEVIEAQFANLEEKIPVAKEMFNAFMDSIEDVKIIGDKGVVIEYGVNKEGYIVYEEGSMNFFLDLSDISKVTGKEELEAQGIIKLEVKFKTDIKNINNEIELELPQVDENNSIRIKDIMDMINIGEQPAEANYTAVPIDM